MSWALQVLKQDVGAATDLLGKLITVRRPSVEHIHKRAMDGSRWSSVCGAENLHVPLWGCNGQNPKFTDGDVDCEKAGVISTLQEVRDESAKVE